MRNLKRVLSLALALVMVLGMMVITTSAADYADADEITNKEAVEVMSALGVITGDNGSFYPNRVLTREEGAALICYLLMGKDNADKLTGNGVFSDVKATRWSAGEIEYCANLGIIGGNGDGTFDPSGKLTAVMFGKMLLCALGYDAEIQGYGGGNWASAIAADMIEVGLDVRGVAMNADLTREKAAQMALQALEATLVDYTNGTNITTSDGTSIKVDATIYNKGEYAESAADSYDVTDTTPYTQFVEKYFSDLKKAAGADDDFGRPASYKWTLKGKTIYNATKTPSLVYTDDMNNAAGKKQIIADLKDLGVTLTNLGSGNYQYATGLRITGNPTGNDYCGTTDRLAGLTGNGTLVEVYVNPVTKAVTNIVAVAYSTKEVQSITTDKKTGDVTYKIGGVEYDITADVKEADEIVVYDDIKRGDVVTFVDSLNGPVYVYATEVFQGTQTAKKSDGITLTIDGEKYVVGASVDSSTFNNGKDVFNYYKDQYGYLVSSTSTATASTDYLKVVDVQGILTQGIDGKTPAVKVRAVLADGTVGVYDVAVKNQGGTWKIDGLGTAFTIGSTTTAADIATQSGLNDKIFGYVLEDGVLTLENLAWTSSALTAADSGEIFGFRVDGLTDDTNAYTVTGSTSNTVLMTQDTIVVNYDNTEKEATVYTGFDALPDLTAATAKVVVKAGMGGNASITSAVVVFVETTSTVKAINEYVYIDADKYTEVGSGATKTYTYTGTYADGETVDLSTKTKLTAGADGLYKVNADGTLGTIISADAQFLASAALTVSGDMIKSGSNFYYLTDDTQVVYINPALDEVDGNTGIVVLEKNSKNVAAIFVTAD